MPHTSPGQVCVAILLNSFVSTISAIEAEEDAIAMQSMKSKQMLRFAIFTLLGCDSLRCCQPSKLELLPGNLPLMQRYWLCSSLKFRYF